MTREKEAIELMAAAQLARDGMADGFDADALPWDAAGEHLQCIYRESAAVALDALLSPSSVPCPTCDNGLVYYGTDEHGGAEPCPDCTDGTRSVPPLLVWNEEA